MTRSQYTCIFFRVNERKMTGNIPNLDFVNIIPYINFGEILSIYFNDIERK